MNVNERKFLIAVERGDLNTLKVLLNLTKRRLDINCCDPLARNALIIAIDNENLEMVKILIEAGIEVGDALLYAIDENFVEAVELLLDNEASTYKPGKLHSWEQVHENSTFSADMTPLILAAHRNNFEVIKILLDRGVALIPDPHDPRCNCKTCCTARSEDCLKHSRSRINAYRALASPCLMALSSPDPMLTAFELSAKLESLAMLEPEYKSDYLKLRAQCQTFATKLLDHTRTSKELEILLNYSEEYLDDHDHVNDGTCHDLCCQQGSLVYETFGSLSTASTSLVMDGSSSGYTEVSMSATPTFDTSYYYKINEGHLSESTTRTKRGAISAESSGKRYKRSSVMSRMHAKDSVLSLDSVTGRHESYKSHMRLARLRLAIHCKQKTFCAHPNIQELLATMWYENLPGFRRKNPIAQTIQVILIGIMFPVYSIAYLVAPKSKLGRYIKRPFIKFICHSASYITFLIVLILASQRVEAFYCWDTILSIFSREVSSTRNSPIFANDSDYNLFKQMGSGVDVRQSVDLFADTEINTLAALYKQLGANAGQTSARGLDSLTKIFEQLPASSKKRGTLPSPIEVLILIWVVSLIWAEIKQVRSLGMNYYKSDMWNTLDSVASGFYIGAIVLRFISYMQSNETSIEVAREHWQAYDPTLLSEGLFAAATIFSALKLVYIFSVNPYLGPLQISLGRMIIDIVRFSWIYILVLFSFACGMNQLLWYYADLERHQCLNITNYSLAQYYSSQRDSIQQQSTGKTLLSDGVKQSANSTTQSPPDEKFMEDAFSSSLEDDSLKPPVTLDDSCKTWRYFSNVFESSQTLFWATFGLVDLENFDLTGIRQYTRFWALLMFGCYCFINVIVVLNLLIAMMNHSYVKISKKSDIEWKFARTRLWMSYFDTGSTVPAPFNIIPSIKSTINATMFVTNMVTKFFSQLLTIRIPSSRKQEAKISCIPMANPAVKSSSSSTSSLSTSSLSSIEQQKASLNNAIGDESGTTIGYKSAYANSSCISNGSSSRFVPPSSRCSDQNRRCEMGKRNCNLTAKYRNVMRSLVRRYLVNEQRLVERKRELTEAKLNRWAKLNAFE